jgi:hypothetical protein
VIDRRPQTRARCTRNVVIAPLSVLLRSISLDGFARDIAPARSNCVVNERETPCGARLARFFSLE